jgi:hypothetical protein
VAKAQLEKNLSLCTAEVGPISNMYFSGRALSSIIPIDVRPMDWQELHATSFRNAIL